MLIKCPDCSKPNDLNLDTQVKCGHCKEPLTGYTYGKIKKSMGAIVVAFGVGVIGTKELVNYKGHMDRYSITDEYAIIEMCLNTRLNEKGIIVIIIIIVLLHGKTLENGAFDK